MGCHLSSSNEARRRPHRVPVSRDRDAYYKLPGGAVDLVFYSRLPYLLHGGRDALESCIPRRGRFVADCETGRGISNAVLCSDWWAMGASPRSRPTTSTCSGAWRMDATPRTPATSLDDPSPRARLPPKCDRAHTSSTSMKR